MSLPLRESSSEMSIMDISFFPQLLFANLHKIEGLRRFNSVIIFSESILHGYLWGIFMSRLHDRLSP